MPSLHYHTRDSYATEIFSQLGRGKRHARELYSHWMRKGTFDGFEVEPQARGLVKEILALTDSSLPGYRVPFEGETKKVLIQLKDGLECETVHIPMATKSTLCISSQVGCLKGCTFCETGRMGLLRSLEVEEIVGQVVIARHCLGLKVNNIVFMGMGEPFDNLESVLRAIEVLTDDGGLAFGPSKITVSTSGVVDKIDAFGERADPGVRLAISVNAPNDAIRKKIMPVTRKWNMEALYGAMERFCNQGREIFVEYVLLDGVNDSDACADELADYLRGLKVKVNLIPYNAQSVNRFAPPPKMRIEAFAKKMVEHGYLTFVRETKGDKIMAACGQLGDVSRRKQVSRVISVGGGSTW